MSTVADSDGGLIPHKLSKLNKSAIGPQQLSATTFDNFIEKPITQSTKLQKGLAAWGVLNVISILANAIKRLSPIAMQVFVQNDLTPTHWAILGAWTLYMAYTEGYSAFQLKFAPLVVRRSFTIGENPSLLKIILAGPYSMGLFCATKKRMITSWSITVGVFALVSIVKKLPYPWRSIIDAGVLVGLSYGTVAICWQFIRALFGKLPDVDPCLPSSGATVKKTA